MDFIKSMNISASGLTAQRQRMDIISSNLANVESTRTPGGGAYRRKDVVFASVPDGQNFESFLRPQLDGGLTEVKVVGIYEDPKPPRTVYDPGHPDADAKGYVSLPNINVVAEMVNMLSASRSYEANITALNATKNMALKALEIGK